MKKAPFLVIDGGDGAGKSTQLEALQKKYPNIIFSREPGGSPYAEHIRSAVLSKEAGGVDPFALLLAFFSGRVDHILTTVIPHLEKGEMVITDRFDSSSFAYQLWGKNNQHLIPEFEWLRERSVSKCFPNLYIYFDVDPAEGLRRKQLMKNADLNHFDFSSLEEVTRRREGYFEFFKRFPQPHCIIDANQSAEKVFADFEKVILEQLALVA